METERKLIAVFAGVLLVILLTAGACCMGKYIQQKKVLKYQGAVFAVEDNNGCWMNASDETWIQ